MDKVTELLQRLKHHDWFYSYSDDHGVYLKGLVGERALVKDLIALTRHEREFVLSSEAVPHELREGFRALVIRELFDKEEKGK